MTGGSICDHSQDQFPDREIPEQDITAGMLAAMSRAALKRKKI
jgi:hypothetical protein